MHSWVFRNRTHLKAVYAVGREDAPLEATPLQPMRAPGQVLREGEDVVLVPHCAKLRPRASA